LTRSTCLERTIAEVRQLAELIEPAPLASPVCRDSADDHVLAVALAANADVIVSGDDDLLVLGSFAGIPIVTPAAAVKRLMG
jgi:putative PIN family toxin of toxin-antitoxin system